MRLEQENTALQDRLQRVLKDKARMESLLRDTSSPDVRLTNIVTGFLYNTHFYQADFCIRCRSTVSCLRVRVRHRTDFSPTRRDRCARRRLINFRPSRRLSACRTTRQTGRRWHTHAQYKYTRGRCPRCRVVYRLSCC